VLAAAGGFAPQGATFEQLMQLQHQIAQQLHQLQELQLQQLADRRNLHSEQQAAHQAVPQVHHFPPQQPLLQPLPVGHALYAHQLAPANNVPNAHAGVGLNVFGLQDFSYFPPTYSMNTTSAAQLGKFCTIAGATITWTRRVGVSVPLKIQSYPRGNMDGVEGKTRSRVFDIPYATDVIQEQYAFISDAPIQLTQRENILDCFIGNCRSWAQYILPLVGGDPRRLPVFVGSLKDVIANIQQLAIGFGTPEYVVLCVCHLISVQNIVSCLTPGDMHTLQNPLDISSNYFQGSLSKMMMEYNNRSRLPPPQQQQQGVRRPLPIDGDAPPQQGGGRQRPRGSAAPPPSGGPVNPTRFAPIGCCRKFWLGEACFIPQNGQPCRYRHQCRTCQAVVTPAEASGHLRSHVI
jgi:hypothetical protein